MTKHTAAPWESTASTPEDGFECFFIHAGEGYSQRQIATVDGLQDEKGEANARLIAAAPELLEALKEIIPKNLNLFNNLPDKSVIPMDFTMGEFRKIAAAIAKAEVQA